MSGKLQQGDQQGHAHAGFDAQLTIARASLAVAGAAAARSSYMDELSHQTSADTPDVFYMGLNSQASLSDKFANSGP